MKVFSGKNVLVTGSAKGIGRGIALAFAKAGANLFLHYRSNPAEAESLLAEVRHWGAEAVLHRADLAETAELNAMFGTIAEQFGFLDAAVNNAGWDPGTVTAADIDEALYRKLTDINIKGTLFCCLREMELMRRRGGSIVNIGSVQMNTTVPGRILYAASKGAIHSMSGAMALECAGLGIRVNTIAPGYIAVERMTAVSGFAEQEIAAGIPVRRLGTPEDVGELAVFLCSGNTGFINGETIVIDGGVNRKLARFSP